MYDTRHKVSPTVGETLADGVQELVRILRGKHHRRLQLDHVVVRPVAAHQYPVDGFHPLDHRLGGAGRRQPALPVRHQLDAHEQAGAAHIAHQLILVRQGPRLLQQVAADAQRVLLQPLLVDHAHDRVRDRARHRIATVLERVAENEMHQQTKHDSLSFSSKTKKKSAAYRVEVADAGGGKAFRNLGRGDDRPDRMPVAHRFRHRHYVRHDAVRLERPVVRADPPEADLHLVRDRYATGLAYRAVKERNPVPSVKWPRTWLLARGRAYLLVHLLEVAGRRYDLPAAALQTLRNEGGHPGRAAVQQPLHLVRVQLAQVGTVRIVTVAAAKDSLGVRYLLVERDHLVPAGVLAGEPQRQIVRLRAGVDEVADGQVAGHLFRERLGALDELVVQEAVVGRQGGQLARPGLHHLRMAVSNCGRESPTNSQV
uniref:Uncharacterized protein n=1 Tax=Anopheles merus TaxID=30066 RepID=A0A182VCU7_ANOME